MIRSQKKIGAVLIFAIVFLGALFSGKYLNVGMLPNENVDVQLIKCAYFSTISLIIYAVLIKLGASVYSSSVFSVFIPFIPYFAETGNWDQLKTFIPALLTMYCIWCVLLRKKKNIISIWCINLFVNALCDQEYLCISLLILICVTIICKKSVDSRTWKILLGLTCSVLIGWVVLNGIVLRDGLYSLSDISENIKKTKADTLKVIELFLPVSNHRIGVFSLIRKQYDSVFGVSGENNTKCIGGFLSLFYLYGIIMIFIRKKDSSMIKKVAYYAGILNVALILAAAEGGLGVLLAMLGVRLTSYNNFFSYILSNTLIMSAIVLDCILDNLKICRKIEKYDKLIKISISVLIIMCVLYDVTPLNY